MKLVDYNEIDLFITKIYTFEFSEYPKDEFIDLSYRLKETIKSNDKSNIKGYQTPGLETLKLEESDQSVVIKIHNIIKKGAAYISETLGIDENKYEFFISSSWLNINYPDSHNVFHHHGNTGYSGVFYIKKLHNDIDGSLEFEDPRRDGMLWESPRRTLFEINDLSTNHFHYHTLNGNEGDLYIFPSYLSHRVKENNSSTDRISFSFNFNWHDRY